MFPTHSEALAPTRLLLGCPPVAITSFFPLCPSRPLSLVGVNACPRHHWHCFGPHTPCLLMNPRLQLSVSEARKEVKRVKKMSPQLPTSMKKLLLQGFKILRTGNSNTWLGAPQYGGDLWKVGWNELGDNFTINVYTTYPMSPLLLKTLPPLLWLCCYRPCHCAFTATISCSIVKLKRLNAPYLRLLTLLRKISLGLWPLAGSWELRFPTIRRTA